MIDTALKTAPVTYRPEDYTRPQSLDTLKRMGQSVELALADAMPAFMRSQGKALLRALYTEVQKNPSLMNCSPQSLFGCTIQAGQLGLMLGSGLGQAYLIPFKGAATLVIGYKGYIQLVNRSGQVGIIFARTVYDGDKFQITYGSSPVLHHEPGVYETVEAISKRKSIGFYATCQTKNGSVFHYLTRPEAEYHRMRFSLMKNGGPWTDHFDAMAMKTAIIKLCKYLPMSAEVQNAIHIDESYETDTPYDASFLFADTTGMESEPLPQTTTEKLRGKLDKGKVTTGQLIGTEPQQLPD